MNILETFESQSTIKGLLIWKICWGIWESNSRNPTKPQGNLCRNHHGSTQISISLAFSVLFMTLFRINEIVFNEKKLQ